MHESLLTDLRYAARMLFKSPAFTVVAVLSLGLGIGVNTTIFSIVNAVLLRPLPVESPEELVEIYTQGSDGYPYDTSSYPDYREMRDRSTSFAGIMTHEVTILNLDKGEGPSELIFGEAVSGNYFDVLGIEAAMGRTFAPDEYATPGTHPVVVLGHGFWQKHFNGAPDVVGDTIKVNGNTLTVIGVVSAEFTGTYPIFAPDVFTTMAMQVLLNPGGPDPEYLEQRGSRSSFITGRLGPGVSIEEAEAELEIIMANLSEAYPDTNRGRSANLLPVDEVRIHPFVDGAIIPVAGLLMGVVGLVLIIACANVANMLLSRASVRRQEIAVRLALGAARWRLVRQLLTESVLLSLAGGVLGLIMAYWATGLILAFQPPIPVSVALDLGLDVRVLAFTVLAALVTGVAFGLAPALQASRPDLVAALKDEAARGGRSSRRFGLRNALVVAQVAVSLVLLIAAGLFLRSLSNAQDIDPGFRIDGIVLMSTALDLVGYSDEQAEIFSETLLDDVRAMPGVSSATLADNVQVGMGVSTTTIRTEGVEVSEEEQLPSIDYVKVGPAYFETFEIPLVAGRHFAATDIAEAPPVAIINEAAARRFFPGESPLGKRIARGRSGEWMEVVGVTRDYKVRTLGEDWRPRLHIPLAQSFDPFLSLVVRTDGDAAAMVEQLRSHMLSMDPDLVFLQAGTMEETISITTFPVRMGAQLLSVFGFLALGLAAVGLYGVVAFAVSQRTHEIGLRMAMGAEQRDVLVLVVRQGMGIVLVGVAVGLLVATGVTWLLSGFLYGIGAVDPITFVVTSLVLIAVALAANFLPALRASRVDPLIALRFH